MSQLFAIVYDGPDEARGAADGIGALARSHTLSLRDMVVATRAADGTVTLDKSVDPVAGGALGDAFWGGLVGLVFTAPVPGNAVGALGGWLTDYDIDDDFIREVSERLRPGRAAVFVLADNLIVDKLAPALGKVRGESIYSVLTCNVDAVVSAALAGTLRDANEGDDARA